jgi:hypothetical protein
MEPQVAILNLHNIQKNIRKNPESGRKTAKIG